MIMEDDVEPIKFYSIKDEVRILGVDDAPFDSRRDKKTYIVGTVFRGGTWLDGVLRSEVDVDGRDSTDRVIEMVNKSRFRDLRVIMLDGLGFGGFNLVDIERLYLETGKAVIAVVRRMPDLSSIKKIIQNLEHREFYESCIQKAGDLRRVETRAGHSIYVQCHGIRRADAEAIVKLSSTRSLIPEPIRVAHLIASGFVLGESRGGA